VCCRVVAATGIPSSFPLEFTRFSFRFDITGTVVFTRADIKPSTRVARFEMSPVHSTQWRDVPVDDDQYPRTVIVSRTPTSRRDVFEIPKYG